MTDFIKKYKFELILGAIIVLYIGIFSFFSIKRYRTLNSYYYDLGIMDQVVFNTSKGRFLEMTNQQLKKNTSRLAIHFDPILAIFAPLYKLYPSPKVLLVGQTVILALGALAVYLIGSRIIKKKAVSFLFAVCYLCFFPVQRVVLFDFHAVALATTFFLFAIYFNLVKKNHWSFIFILLSLLTKEHVGLVVFLYGVYLKLIKKEKKFGLTVLITGLIFFITTVYLIIPYFRQESHFALRYYEDFGDKPSTILYNIFRHPLVTVRYLFRRDTFEYVSRIITPNFYSLFSPLALLIAAPELAINILSFNGNMRSIFFHYNSLIIPFIYFSLILGYQKLGKMIKNSFIKKAVLIVFIILNLYSYYQYNPLPVSSVKRPAVYKKLNRVKAESINKWQQELADEGIKLATTPRLAPFFTHRQYYYNFLFDSAFASMGYTEEEVLKARSDVYMMADYVIIDRDEIGDLSSGGLAVKFYQRFLEDENYQVIFTDDQSIEVYKKI